MASWFVDVQISAEYKYIDGVCNRTKHTFDVYLKLSISLLGGGNIADINPFFKKSIQDDKHAVVSYLKEIYNFAAQKYTDFLVALQAEIIQEKHIDSRYHKIKIYQKK